MSVLLKAGARGLALATFGIIFWTSWQRKGKSDNIDGGKRWLQDEDLKTCAPYSSYRGKVKNLLECGDVIECTEQITALVGLEKQRGIENVEFEYAVSMAKKRDETSDPLYPEIQQKATSTEDVIKSLPDSLKQKSNWGDDMFPDLIVVGLHKAGSGHLYSLLATHSGATDYIGGLGGKVDECASKAFVVGRDHTNDEVKVMQEALFNFYERVEEKSKSDAFWNDRLKVNYCSSIDDVILRYRYLNVQKNPQIFLLIRDPADWLWSLWTSWPDKMIDAPGLFRRQRYRSPELFHEIIVGANRTYSGMAIISKRYYSIKYMMMLEEVFGDENVHILRSEDMLPDVVNDNGKLDELSRFTGLSPDGFQLAQTKAIHNCNDKQDKRESCEKPLEGRYEISGHRPMLEKTRKLIYLHFFEECKVWIERWGISYDHCLDTFPAR